MTRTLYYGDNLEVLRKHIDDETVDLIYLAPPFNSNRDYNLLFKEQSGEPAQAQIKAFTDTWQWSEHAYQTFLLECSREALTRLIEGFVNTLGRNDLTAYLVMMAPRLIELHRVLKPTGSLYLHCDPTASHYLKVMLDVIFGAKNFRNEVVWKRDPAGKGAKRVSRQWPRDIDVMLFYTKSNAYVFHQQYAPLSEAQKKCIDMRMKEDATKLSSAVITAMKCGKSSAPKGASMSPAQVRSMLSIILMKHKPPSAASGAIFWDLARARLRRNCSAIQPRNLSPCWSASFKPPATKGMWC
jgi:DNA modification methylase